MKIYVLSIGDGVQFVSPVREEVEVVALGSVLMDHTEHEWRQDEYMHHRSQLFVKNARSGRWSNARYVVTELEMKSA